MKYLFYYIILPVFFLLFGCNPCESFGVTSLGNKFKLVEADKDDIAIIYCTSQTCCSSGIPIVPSKIIKYKYDSRWIIAKSANKQQSTYWLIDKDFKVEFKYDSDMDKKILSYVTGPLDSVSFTQKLANLEIDLKF